MPRPGGPSAPASATRRQATMPSSSIVPELGMASSSVMPAPTGTSASVSTNRPPRDRLTEYATRNDDGVRNSTCTTYGMRVCSRSDTGAEYHMTREGASRLQHAIEQLVEMIEIHVANLDRTGLAGLVLGDG